MSTRRVRLALGVLGAVFLLLAAALLGVGGCGEKEEAGAPGEFESNGVPTTTAFMATTIAGDATPSYVRESAYGGEVDTADPGTLSVLEAASGQKIIADAVLDIEVEQGCFGTAFEQARLIADRYGGYLVSSQAFAGGEEEGLKSGTVVVRVPSSSFNRALSDAGKLGSLKSEQIQTQDVTEEYVDLQARIANSEAHVKALLALLAKAETVDEILQVQQTLTYAQQELEQLKGRMRYLEEHTSFSTLTMNIREAGVEVVIAEEWGIVQALKDAFKNFVHAVNAIVRGLGLLIPVLIVLVIVGYIVYRVWRAAIHRSRARRLAQFQAPSYPGQQYQPSQYQAQSQSGPAEQSASGSEPGSGEADAYK